MTQKTETPKEVAVRKVVVQLGKKELILDIEDAKQLKDVLNELFGQVVVEKVAPQIEKTIIREEHHYHKQYQPYWYWNQPAIMYTSGGLTGIIGSTSNGTASYSLNSNTGSINCSIKPTNPDDTAGGGVLK